MSVALLRLRCVFAEEEGNEGMKIGKHLPLACLLACIHLPVYEAAEMAVSSRRPYGLSLREIGLLLGTELTAIDSHKTFSVVSPLFSSSSSLSLSLSLRRSGHCLDGCDCEL